MTRLAVNRAALRPMSVEQLIAIAEVIALQRHDGHFSVLRFTTHWKVTFETPRGMFPYSDLIPKKTLRQALEHAIAVELEAMR